MKRKHKIKNMFKVQVLNEETAKMYLYGDIGESWWSDSNITLKKVKNELEEITAENIELHINSYGGDIFESIAISNLLKSQEKNITVIIDGIAASGGSIIAMAGNTIKMFKNSEMMIHNPWTCACGNAKELRKIADDLEVMQSSLEETYMERFNKSIDDLKDLLDNESFFNAQKCIDYGLADEIIDDKTSEEEETSEEVADYNDLLNNQSFINSLIEKVKIETNKTVETPKENNDELNPILKLFI